ncbi:MULTISPECIES: putative quinol monooxygenase [Methylovorus]|mgnify:CR=1 FL=1|jgi:quinol monooxygenase YgiN|uniref:Antibiotic biosynthesis monooxygenase n=1 Tax=Methylovorus glucosotrophus (strain SIP3-4) TaxID=582744 RepID=C6XDA8_METGS|nr:MULTISPECIES: antibiotic biosynthesis monooxygenase [Methylovorus]ACT50533.1 conserved hypothetical protein [Methylovorus glucosotrophus SIP3-4]ADQ84524.1 conserved hypothetical protein [Methylovorus sp. MP688]KAF0844062.1 quinol monooxygenase YgiN [Methylovorus glucosotrophus]MCB5206403.1 antibiotic biosynthesis monooxygenase [Methylovorus mays]
MSKTALYVRLEAKPEKAKEVEEFLKNALPLVLAESETITWYALKFTDTAFGIFDSFSSEDGRNSHLKGKVADALFAVADDLLAEQPVIIPVDLLASKIGAESEVAGAQSVNTKKYGLRFIDGL